MRIVGGLDDQQKKAQIFGKLAQLAEEINEMPIAPKAFITLVFCEDSEGTVRRIEHIGEHFNAFECMGVLDMVKTELMELVRQQSRPHQPHQPPENPA